MHSSMTNGSQYEFWKQLLGICFIGKLQWQIGKLLYWEIALLGNCFIGKLLYWEIAVAKLTDCQQLTKLLVCSCIFSLLLSWEHNPRKPGCIQA